LKPLGIADIYFEDNTKHLIQQRGDGWDFCVLKKLLWRMKTTKEREEEK